MGRRDRRQRRRRVAAVGGAAYAAGKHRQAKQAAADAPPDQAEPPPAAPRPAAAAPAPDPMQQLKELGELHEQGVLTDEEFAAQKAVARRLSASTTPDLDAARTMCRWNAYFGESLLIDEFLYRTEHGLIDESLHSRMGAETTNGDGFGLGWYMPGHEEPGRYRSVNPAWNDANLRDLASHVESSLFLAHIRAAVGSPVQQTNCHPFRHGRWLFVHNGLLHGFHDMRRDLLLAVEPSLFEGISGSADSEVLFYLALSFGLEEDPIGGVERAIGLVEATGEAHGDRAPLPRDGGLQRRRAALGGALLERTQVAQPVHLAGGRGALRELHPHNPRLGGTCRGGPRDRVRATRGPVGRMPEVPESTALVIEAGADEQLPFKPSRP